MTEPDPTSADVFVELCSTATARRFLHQDALAAVILDEGQNNKNPIRRARERCGRSRPITGLSSRARQSKTACSICEPDGVRHPGILGQRGYFERQFEKRDDPLARQRIAARLRPFLLRRTKREVAPDLPPRVEEDICASWKACRLTFTARS